MKSGDKVSAASSLPDAKYVRALRRITALTVKRPAISPVQPSGSPGARRERLEKLLDGNR